MVAILIMSGKMATLSFLELNIFWNKGYDVLIFKLMTSPTKLYHVIQIKL